MSQNVYLTHPDYFYEYFIQVHVVDICSEINPKEINTEKISKTLESNIFLYLSLFLFYIVSSYSNVILQQS